MADDKPVIIVKKKGGHGGHHGGAWKVAYADFVTAMMAFFMVMWLVNSAEVSTRQNIASYFRRPGLFESGSGTPLMIGQAGILEDAYVPPHPSEMKHSHGKSQEALPAKSGTDAQDSEQRVTLRGEPGQQGSQGEAKGINIEQIKIVEGIQTGTAYDKQGRGNVADGELGVSAKKQKEAMESLAEEVRKQVERYPELEELLGIVDVKVEADGLNIEIIDTEKTSMFRSGSATISGAAKDAFSKLSEVLEKVPNKIDILGHTDAVPYASPSGTYSNWELSADRANAARRLLTSEGISPQRIISVVGKAARDPRDQENPFAASNRRITLKMRFDRSVNVDLSQQPEAIQEITSQAPAPEEGDSKPNLHAWTPKEVVQAQKGMKRKTVPLPEDAPPIQTPESAKREKDKIFGTTPVFGPDAPFTGP